jgi:hypothetical protein
VTPSFQRRSIDRFDDPSRRAFSAAANPLSSPKNTSAMSVEFQHGEFGGHAALAAADA